MTTLQHILLHLAGISAGIVLGYVIGYFTAQQRYRRWINSVGKSNKVAPVRGER